MKTTLPFDKSLVIIPTYNEINNIRPMTETIFDLYSSISLLVVDDTSTDGTTEKIKELQTKYSRLHLIERKGKRGLGPAYITGFKWALEKNFLYIFQIDCDFSHDPKQIVELLDTAQTHDLVIGSRYTGGIRIINWPFRRLFLSYFASIYIRTIMGLPLKDPTGGFKCFSRKALEKLELDKIFSNGYSFQLELNYKIWIKNMKIKEIPIIFYERREGHSKMNISIIIEAIFAVFRLRIRNMFSRL